MQNKIFNFIIILYLGVLCIYLMQVPPTVLIQTEIYDKDGNLIPMYNDMCQSFEFRA